jgi:hypothetical protein
VCELLANQEADLQREQWVWRVKAVGTGVSCWSLVFLVVSLLQSKLSPSLAVQSMCCQVGLILEVRLRLVDILGFSVAYLGCGG